MGRSGGTRVRAVTGKRLFGNLNWRGGPGFLLKTGAALRPLILGVFGDRYACSGRTDAGRPGVFNGENARWLSGVVP